MRKKSAILFVALATLTLAGCGSGVTVEGDAPIEIPEQVEVGGVTVHTPDAVDVGDAKIETEDGRVTVE